VISWDITATPNDSLLTMSPRHAHFSSRKRGFWRGVAWPLALVSRDCSLLRILVTVVWHSMCSEVRNDQMRLKKLLMFVSVRGVIEVEFESEVCGQKQCAALITHIGQASRPFSPPQRADISNTKQTRCSNTNRVRFRSLVSTNVRKKYLGFLQT